MFCVYVSCAEVISGSSIRHLRNTARACTETPRLPVTSMPAENHIKRSSFSIRSIRNSQKHITSSMVGSAEEKYRRILLLWINLRDFYAHKAISLISSLQSCLHSSANSGVKISRCFMSSKTSRRQFEQLPSRYR